MRRGTADRPKQKQQQKSRSATGNRRPVRDSCTSHISGKMVEFTLPFEATVCKTVCPMLSDRCLYVLSCLYVCLSVTLVYCGQMVGWIRMPLWPKPTSTWYECRPRPRPHCVRWGRSSPKRGTTAPTFWSMSIVAKCLDGPGYHLVQR